MKAVPIRVFIVDDHPLVREWLANLLALQPGFEVAGQAEDPGTALAQMARLAPAVAVIDLTLKRGSGFALIKDLRAQVPATRLVVLSMHEELSDVERALRAGAHGYVMKRDATHQICDAIREVAAGRIFVAPPLLAELAGRAVGRPRPAEESNLGRLSDRELDIFRRIGRGENTRHIATALGVSLATVQSHCAQIREKLGLSNASQLARVAAQLHCESAEKPQAKPDTDFPAGTTDADAPRR